MSPREGTWEGGSAVRLERAGDLCSRLSPRCHRGSIGSRSGAGEITCRRLHKIKQQKLLDFATEMEQPKEKHSRWEGSDSGRPRALPPFLGSARLLADHAPPQAVRPLPNRHAP
jgi:hypothetical protein